VRGVWAGDEGLLEWDKSLSRKAGRYVEEYVSPYSIAREVLDDLEPGLRNGTHEVFREISDAYPALHDLYMSREEVLDNLRQMNRLVHDLLKWGQEAQANISSYEAKADEVLDRLEEARGYYINLSTAYNQTLNSLQEIRERTQQLAQAIAGVDEAYAEAYASAQHLYPQILQLNLTAAEFARLYNMTSAAYLKTVFDVARVHYYLLTHTRAYETGLTEADIAGVINYTPLIGEPVTPDEVVAIYSAMMRAGDPASASIGAVHAVAAEITEAMIPYPQARALIPYLSMAAASVSEELLAAEGINDYSALLSAGDVEGQLALVAHLRQAVKEALPQAAVQYAQVVAAEIAGESGYPWAKDTLTELIAGAASLGYPPSKEGLEKLVVDTAATIAAEASGMQVDYVRPLAQAVYEGGPAPEALRPWLLSMVSADPRMPGELAEVVVDTVIRCDPGGTAYLAAGRVQAVLAASEIIGGMAGVDPSFVFSVAATNTSLSKYAIEVMLEKAPPTVDRRVMEEALRTIAAEGGRLSPEGFAAFVEAITPDLPTSLAEDLARMVWEGSLSHDDALRLVLLKDLVEKCLKEYWPLGGVTGEVNLTNLPIIDAVIEGSFSIDAVADTLEAVANGSLPGNVSVADLVKALAELPPDAGDEKLAQALASATLGEGGADLLVDVLVRGEHPLEVLASKVAEGFADKAGIDESIVKPAVSASIVLGNESVLWSAVWSSVEDKVLDNVTAELVGKMISPDGSSFIVLFRPREEPSRYGNAILFKSLVESTLEGMGRDPYFVGVTGDDVLMEEAMNASKADIDRVNKISIIAPILIALALIGGLVAAGLPFIGIGLSVLTSSAALYAMSLAGIVDVTSWSRMLMITTSFGLGMDYSSYIVLRFKEKIAELGDAAAAAHDALMHSLPAIAAASSTDIIGFAVMTLARDFPLLASIGKTVPIAILAVLAASLTFTPAVLAKFGGNHWFWWPHRPEAGRRGWSGIKFTKRVAVVFIIISVIAAGVGAYGLATFQGSHDYSVFMPEGTEGYVTYEVLKTEFPAGQLLPVYVVGVAEGDVHDPAVKASIADLVSRLRAVNGVKDVRWLGDGGEQYVGPDNRTFYIEVILGPSPLSREGIGVVAEVKGIVKSFSDPHLRELHVGGVPAASLEIEELLERDFWGLIFPVSLVLMWLAMAASFRSVLSGAISLATIGVGYMLGVWAASAVPAVFGQPALWFLPLMTFPAVLGVGMDYNSFFLNREREEMEKVAGMPSAGYVAVTRAVRAVSHLVIGLGTIVAATYASLLIGSSWGVRELGIALTVGVVVTTLMAAVLLTPAIAALISKKTWWPYSRRWRRRHGDTEDF